VGLIALIGFGVVVLLAMVLLHGYLWWRLVRGTTQPGRTRRLLTLLTVVLALLPTLAVLNPSALSCRVGPGGVRAAATKRLRPTRGWQLAAVRSVPIAISSAAACS
jgi:hypothetical protein